MRGSSHRLVHTKYGEVHVPVYFSDGNIIMVFLFSFYFCFLEEASTKIQSDKCMIRLHFWSMDLTFISKFECQAKL